MKSKRWIALSVVVLILCGAGIALSQGWFTEQRNMYFAGDVVAKKDLTVQGTFTSNGAVAAAGSQTFTLGATEKLLIDGSTTAQTQTAGALDLNVSSGTANVSGFNVSLTTPTGTAAGTDVFAGIITLTQNDADADMFGLKITAAATTNAAANSYEYGIGYDCAENSAGACIDGILITSSGTNGGMVDGLDVSAANITYGVNTGVNPILGGNAETLTIGATDAVFLLSRNDSGTVTLTSSDDDSTAALTIDPGGNTTLTLGSASDTVSVTATSGITLSNSETISNGTNGTVFIGRNDSGTVILSSKDDDATANLTIDPGGSSTLQLNGDSNDNLLIIGSTEHRAGDVTITADSTGGNAGTINQFIGIPRIMNVGISTMVNGAAAGHTVLTDLNDETPAGEWTAIDADTVMSNDSSYYRQGTASLKMAIATTADATDGCTNTLASGDQDWTDDEAVGMWIWSDTALDAGDLKLGITDSGAGQTLVNFPAVTASSWQWIEIDISGVANASKDVIQSLTIELSAAGAAKAAGGAFNVYMDFIVKWDVGDEDTLGAAILTDGVMSVTVIDATDSGATSANLTMYTDYFVHYQSGNDAIVMITDQSGADKVGLALIAY